MKLQPVLAATAAGRDQTVPVAGSASDAGTRTRLGVVRLDLVCQPQVVETVLVATRRWGKDRALSNLACERLTALVHAAMVHGLRFDPRGVTLLIRWLDPDRVRLDLRWHGCSSTARVALADGDVGATIATLDTLAEEWGFGSSRRGSIQWMVVDTS